MKRLLLTVLALSLAFAPISKATDCLNYEEIGKRAVVAAYIVGYVGAAAGVSYAIQKLANAYDHASYATQEFLKGATSAAVSASLYAFLWTTADKHNACLMSIEQSAQA